MRRGVHAQATLAAALLWAAATLAGSALLLLSRRPHALRPPAPGGADEHAALAARLAALEADNARLRWLAPPPPRLYCLVPASPGCAPERLRAVASTWGARCDVIKFFVERERDSREREREPGRLPPQGAQRDAQLGLLGQIVHLEGCAAEDCRRPMWAWLREHDLEKADFFLAARDQDTWLFPDFVRARLRDKGWRAPEERALVLRLGARGAGASRAALRRAAPALWPLLVDLDAAETPVDAHGLSAVALEPLTDALLAAPRARRPRCCSARPLAFHWRGIAHDLLRLHSLLFNESDTTVERLFWSRAEIDRPALDIAAPLFAAHAPSAAPGDEHDDAQPGAVPQWRARAEVRYLMRVKGSLHDLGVAPPRRRAVLEADHADRLAETEQWRAETALVRLTGETGEALEPDVADVERFLGLLPYGADRGAAAHGAAAASAADTTPSPALDRSDDATRAIQNMFAAVAASRRLTDGQAAFLRGEPFNLLRDVSNSLHVLTER